LAQASREAETLLTNVLKDIALKPALKQKFVERKFIAQLDAPVDSTGELSFTPPHTLQRRAITPYAETTTIGKDQVVVERQGRKTQIALSQVPQLAALSNTMIAVIQGDASPLIKQFTIQLASPMPNGASWAFVLIPKDPKSVGWLREIRISGRKAVLDVFELQLSDGDRSVTRLLPIS
jgi:hypothetical protein